MNLIGEHKSRLDTPCLVLDKNLLIENINNMQQEANNAKKNVRPHVKTHKCIQICKQQIQAGAVGICAAKVSEAFILAENGIKNILITSPVVTAQKIEKMMACLHNDPQLTVVIDSLDNAREINAIAKNCGKAINVLIDLDPHVGRTGIAFEDSLSFVKALQLFSNIKFKGIQCYAGNLQHVLNFEERCKASTQVMNQAALVMRQLQDAKFDCQILSGSGTGTYSSDLLIPAITEIQPGSYTVMDTEYNEVGIKYNTALTLLTTVVSVNQRTHVTCDAGWKALYEVQTKPTVLNQIKYLYDWFGDEHGKITPVSHHKLPLLGEKLELELAHCDPTINMYDSFYVTENDIVVDVWPIDMRGKSQ